jgi:6-pyruvoyltetrahydropterin/6-carboxytetrahydropterin synthase
MPYELMVEGSFDAAHQLIGHSGPCEKLHGHTWKVQAFVNGGKLNKLGMVRDFKEIKMLLQSALSGLDHTNLNIIPYFKKVNPTSENVAKFIFDRIAKKADVTKVTVFESPVTSASYMR